MNTNEMKVEIANDVIALLQEPGRLNPKFAWVYVSFSRDLLDAKSSEDVTNCTVCALGAMLIADVLKKGDIGWFRSCALRSDTRQEIVDRFYEIFSHQELGEIEAAFEDNIESFKMYKRPGQRLMAIMANIVRNKGNFSYQEEEVFLHSMSEEERHQRNIFLG